MENSGGDGYDTLEGDLPKVAEPYLLIPEWIALDELVFVLQRGFIHQLIVIGEEMAFHLALRTARELYGDDSMEGLTDEDEEFLSLPKTSTDAEVCSFF
jgi:hypothetical protein